MRFLAKTVRVSLLWAVILSLMLSSILGILVAPCGPARGGDVLQVRVDPCEKLPCTFKKGRSAKIEMDFHSVNNHSSVSVGIMGKSHGVLLPLPFNQKDGCTSSGLDCPLQAGRNYTVTRAVKVYRIYPKMEILAVFQVSGRGGDVLACVEFPIHIM